MTSKQQFQMMIDTFQQAASDIEQGRLRKARNDVTNLPEPIYEKSLRWYNSKVKDYYYYLIRYVLDSFEYKVMYCGKAGLEEDLSLYLAMFHALDCNKPDIVLDARQPVLVNPDILSTPYHPVRQPRGECKPTPLFN
jgi:hypothetical protein